MTSSDRAQTGSAYCPVAVLEEFMAVGGHTGHSKLFRKIYHSKYGVRLRRQPLTYSRALELVRDIFRNVWLNPKDYGLHSLCSGGASAAAATEVPKRLKHVLFDMRVENTNLAKSLSEKGNHAMYKDENPYRYLLSLPN